MNKQQIREQMQKLTSSITQADKDLAAQKLLKRIQVLVDKANNIAIYQALSEEINLKYLIGYSLNKHKNLYTPISYLNHKTIKFDKYCNVSNDFYKNNYKAIFYPNNYELQSEIQWYNLDLILVPLIAVDKLGNRLGRGGGYYDKTLSNISEFINKPILCGIGYDCRLVDHIPTDYWDVPLNYFISEKRLIKF